MGDTKPRHFFYLGIGVGISLCVVFFSTAMAIANWEMLKDAVWNWQTLITGLLAVGAAVATIFSLEKQIAESREQEEDQRERRKYADRAAMPAALATLLKYGRENLQILVSLKAGGLTPSGEIIFNRNWSAPQVPEFPSVAAETIRKCLETTDRDKRKAIAQILLDLQRINSRLSGILVEVREGSIMVVTESHLSDYIAGALQFITRCDHTIQYARGAEPAPPEAISADAVASKAFFENIYEEDFPLVYEAINRR